MDLLENNGWKKYYQCMCNGSLKQHWQHEDFPEHEIRIRPTRNTFSIFSKNQIIHGPDWLYKIESKMKEYGLLS